MQMTSAEFARVAGLLPALLLSGCLYVSASGAFGSHVDPAVVARIVPGESTKGEVLDLLGPPEEFLRSEVLTSLGDDASRVSGAVALGNRARDAFTYQLDTLSAWASMLLFYNHVRGEIETDLLVIFFDPEDRVREVSFRTVSRKP
jgi:hypothetical protein